MIYLKKIVTPSYRVLNIAGFALLQVVSKTTKQIYISLYINIFN